MTAVAPVYDSPAWQIAVLGEWGIPAPPWLLAEARDTVAPAVAAATEAIIATRADTDHLARLRPLLDQLQAATRCDDDVDALTVAISVVRSRTRHREQTDRARRRKR